MGKEDQINRRDVLAASAAAGITIVSPKVLGKKGVPAFSDKMNIAGIGVGGMGAHVLENMTDENIVALSDVDEKMAAESYKRFPRASRYSDFRVMLEKEKGIDAVVVATPDHTHAVASVAAMQLGKHVFCEKPLAHNVYEIRRMQAEAKKARVATQMGNQGHAGQEIRTVCQWIWDGAIGDVTDVYAWTNRPKGWSYVAVEAPKQKPPVPDTLAWDLWLGPAPKRPYHPAYAPHTWRCWWDFGSGAIGDMGCHILDPVYWALKLGAPRSVEASSTPVNSQTVPHAAVIHWDFPARGDMPPVKLHWYDGGLMPPRPEELEPDRNMRRQGVIFAGTKGKLVCGNRASSPRLIPEKAMRDYELPELTIPRSPGHYAEWINACKTGGDGESNFAYAGGLTEIVMLGNIAVRTGEKLYWDSDAMKFADNAKAEEYLQRDYRSGWTF